MFFYRSPLGLPNGLPPSRRRSKSAWNADSTDDGECGKLVNRAFVSLLFFFLCPNFITIITLCNHIHVQYLHNITCALFTTLKFHANCPFLAVRASRSNRSKAQLW